MFIVIDRGQIDKGFDMTFMEPSQLITKPKHIRKAILNPTENKMVSTILLFSDLIALSITKPGIKVRKSKPRTCLAIGMSNAIAMHIIPWDTSTYTK